MKITKRTFGTLADGTAVSCWTMENAHGLRAELLDYGAAIRSIQVPDRTGRLVDVVLGYDDLAGYTGNPSFYRRDHRPVRQPVSAARNLS